MQFSRAFCNQYHSDLAGRCKFGKGARKDNLTLAKLQGHVSNCDFRKINTFSINGVTANGGCPDVTGPVPKEEQPL